MTRGERGGWERELCAGTCRRAPALGAGPGGTSALGLTEVPPAPGGERGGRPCLEEAGAAGSGWREVTPPASRQDARHHGGGERAAGPASLWVPRRGGGSPHTVTSS